MKAFILAAGEGTRMRPLTANIPKPLLPVAGRPFLDHTVKTLKDGGIQDIIILIGWKARRLKEHYGDGSQWGVGITYAEQEKRLGTANAIELAEPHIDGTFLCLNGDVVLTPNILKGVLSFSTKKKGTVVSLVGTKYPRDYGVVELRDEKVVSIEEKPLQPKSNLINAGIYVFNKNIFEAISKTEKSPRGEFEITTSIQLLAQENDVYGHTIQEEWIDVSRPWDLLKANEILMKGFEAEVMAQEVDERTSVRGAVSIGKGTKVMAGAYITGPVMIGEDCEIGPNCYIRPSTYIGNRCKIGNAVEVKNSIIMDDSKVPHHSYLGDSVIGERCNLGSGTKTANIRLDKSEIVLRFEGRSINTGMRKLGVIMGDDVQTGINSSIDVGTIIG
ncbi:MAG: NTP transferase domain-containing protein, partial [Thermoplasmata archaeon]|nr:NTP transferase domain-containing protein [Thermoplasmata archaeon]